MGLFNHPIIIVAFAVLIVVGGLTIITTVTNTFNEFTGAITRMITGEIEYCVEDSHYTRTLIGSEGLSISREKTDKSEICFKTADETLAQSINDKIQERMLEEAKLRSESNQKWWETIGLPIFAIVVVAIIIILYSRKDSY